MDVQQEREYAQRVREEYAPKREEANKFEQLVRMDAQARRPAEVFAFVFGILGALVLGIGMCLAMEVIGNGLFAVGIVVGVVGIAMVSANYFIYRAIMRSRKKKYADKIVALSDDLLKQ